jgi:hypothetical protein
VQGPPNCIVTGTNISRVLFYLNDAWINTDGNLSNGLGCWVDTRKYADGTYTLKAVAYDSAGRTATATRAIVIRNAGAPTVTSGIPAIVFDKWRKEDEDKCYENYDTPGLRWVRSACLEWARKRWVDCYQGKDPGPYDDSMADGFPPRPKAPRRR